MVENILLDLDVQGTITGRISCNELCECAGPSCNKGKPLELERTGEQQLEVEEFQRSKYRFVE